ncbi:MAG: L-glutamate gamma-semialdehyde dehydrogenase [Bdellovibrio sp.]|nr:L-glutamate gamma-semialdehyde dehydrogenase [Bdellovibrio sp.]
MLELERPVNEPVLSYAKNSRERESILRELDRMAAEKIEIPCIIGGKEIRTGNLRKVVMPHQHKHVLAEFHLAGPKEMEMAASAALKAKATWEKLADTERAAIFLKAADLLAGPFRDRLNAATMLGQSKNVFQAEIDAACEFIDFLRFNAFFYQEIQKNQPIASAGVSNSVEYRPLEGFIASITPFNFTAIAGNLGCAPAMLGNTVVWKPSDTQMLSAYYTMLLLKEAGVPDGVINLVPADGPLFGQTVLPMKDLAGIHFTGSTATFQTLWKTVGENISRYRTYPRLVGETGGKGFVFAHPSANCDALSTALVRGAFEFQGQKCSAASRAFIPQSLWKKVQEKLLSDLATLKMGDVRDLGCFVNAVIDEKAFKRISGYLDHAKNSQEAEIIAGGKAQGEVGYFVEPTVILAQQPTYKSMVEEIFGPVLSIHVYPDQKLEETLRLCDESTPYSLTGAVFAQDRYAVHEITTRLRNTAGNFYINDKPTGAVVGQQPFGGARASGTNDKAGSSLNLYRWLSPRTLKETRVPPTDYRYPFLG